MLEVLKNKILAIKELTGVEITLLPDDGLLINVTEVKVSSNKITKTKEFFALSSINELADKVNKKIPVVLTLNGKGIIVKKTIQAEGEINLSDILPGANPGDFYFTANFNPPHSFISIARKDVIEYYVEALKKMGVIFVNIELGFSAIQSLEVYLSNTTTKTAETPSYIFHFNEKNQLANYEVKPEITKDKFLLQEYSIANQYIHSFSLNGFASVLNFLSEDIEALPKIPVPEIIEQRKELKYSLYYKAGAWSLLIGTFLLLLLNFFVYNYYFGKNKDLAATQLISREEALRIKKQVESLKTKETLIRKTGWDKQSKASYYSDRIAGFLPSNTLLTSLSIFPLKNTFLSDNQFQFKKDTIIITGTCDDVLELNKFINNLKILPETKEAILKNYLNKKESEPGIFNIEMALK